MKDHITLNKVNLLIPKRESTKVYIVLMKGQNVLCPLDVNVEYSTTFHLNPNLVV